MKDCLLPVQVAWSQAVTNELTSVDTLVDPSLVRQVVSGLVRTEQSGEDELLPPQFAVATTRTTNAMYRAMCPFIQPSLEREQGSP